MMMNGDYSKDNALWYYLDHFKLNRREEIITLKNDVGEMDTDRVFGKNGLVEQNKHSIIRLADIMDKDEEIEEEVGRDDNKDNGESGSEMDNAELDETEAAPPSINSATATSMDDYDAKFFSAYFSEDEE